MDIGFWIALINIVILNLILSGDNAVVIGMVARNLPPEQKRKVIILGSAVAILLRVGLTAGATYLLEIPLLMSIGGILLLWIAVKLLVDESHSTHATPGNTLRSAVKTIVIADVVMSLDNVLAIAGAAHGDILLVLIGLALSIPIIMWGSNLIATLLNRLPWLTYIGAGILGYTAGQLIVDDPLVDQYLFQEQNFITQPDLLTYGIPIVLTFLVIVIGFIKKSSAKQKIA